MNEQEAIETILYASAFNREDSPLTQALDMAIKALEKQIPKKPKQSGVTDNEGIFHPTNGINGVPYDLCPNCETNLCTDGYFGRSKDGFNYCENCGQKLDWTVEE